MKKLTIAIILIGFLTFTGCEKKEEISKDDTFANTNENAIKDQTVAELTLTNTSLITKDGESTLVTLVTNSTDSNKIIKTFNIIIKDKDNNIIVTLLGYVGGEVPSGESRTITSTVEMDLLNAVSVEYTVNN